MPEQKESEPETSSEGKENLPDLAGFKDRGSGNCLERDFMSEKKRKPAKPKSSSALYDAELVRQTFTILMNSMGYLAENMIVSKEAQSGCLLDLFTMDMNWNSLEILGTKDAVSLNFNEESALTFKANTKEEMQSILLHVQHLCGMLLSGQAVIFRIHLPELNMHFIYDEFSGEILNGSFNDKDPKARDMLEKTSLADLFGIFQKGTYDLDVFRYKKPESMVQAEKRLDAMPDDFDDSFFDAYDDDFDDFDEDEFDDDYLQNLAKEGEFLDIIDRIAKGPDNVRNLIAPPKNGRKPSGKQKSENGQEPYGQNSQKGRK